MNQGQAKSVSVIGVAGAVAVLIVWLISLLGVTVPAEVSDAFLTLSAAGLGWFAHKEGVTLPAPTQPPGENQ